MDSHASPAQPPRSDRRPDQAQDQEQRGLDKVDRGLEEAFGVQPDDFPGLSVLRILQARSESELGLQLDVPVDVPAAHPGQKSTEAAVAGRDPACRYEVLGEIARGGVGIVYRGHDHDLGRDVAMKVLKDRYANDPEVLARFVEEAQIGGQLQHPGIVPVYELGLQAGERPYFAMKLVVGETLAQQLARCGEDPQDRRRLLAVFEQVCQTVAYAHARRVVHRDLKPANVMIGAFGEVQVVDWGFAKVLDRGEAREPTVRPAPPGGRHRIETSRSRSGTTSVAGVILGTPAYMPPEQAAGDLDRVDCRSDVFALGAILCEILTGEPPYRVVDGDIIAQAENARLEGTQARLRCSGADAALVELCLECLAPVPHARPPSAAEVATRLGRWLMSAEERAQRAETRAAEARYRNRITLVSAAAALVLVSLTAGAWIWVRHSAERQRAANTERVVAAMGGAQVALGKAQAVADVVDLGPWEVAEARAGNLATLLTAEVDLDVRRQADDLVAVVQREGLAARARAERLLRDAAMHSELEALRIPIDDNIRKQGWEQREGRRLDAAYADAFARYLDGAPLLPLSEAALSRLRQTEIRVDLAMALDHWALVRDGLAGEPDAPDVALTVGLREVAAALDPDDPWRNELRSLLPRAASAEDQLRRLARSVDPLVLTSAGCRVLGDALWSAGAKEDAIHALRRARRAYPQDFDLCFRLAVFCERLDKPRWEEVERFQAIANVLQPNHREALHRRAMALERLRKLDDAVPIWETLCRAEPRRAHWQFHLGNNHLRSANLRAAAACYRAVLALDPDDVQDNGQSLANLGTIHLLQGQIEEAIDYFSRALAVNPKLPVRTNLAAARLLRGQVDQGNPRSAR